MKQINRSQCHVMTQQFDLLEHQVTVEDMRMFWDWTLQCVFVLFWVLVVWCKVRQRGEEERGRCKYTGNCGRDDRSKVTAAVSWQNGITNKELTVCYLHAVIAQKVPAVLLWRQDSVSWSCLEMLSLSDVRMERSSLLHDGLIEKLFKVLSSAVKIIKRFRECKEIFVNSEWLWSSDLWAAQH